MYTDTQALTTRSLLYGWTSLRIGVRDFWPIARYEGRQVKGARVIELLEGNTNYYVGRQVKHVRVIVLHEGNTNYTIYRDGQARNRTA